MRTELSVDALVIDPDRLAPLALFAVEAITNAQKHAFAARGGVLSLSFKVHGEEAELEISDDGEGQRGCARHLRRGPGADDCLRPPAARPGRIGAQ